MPVCFQLIRKGETEPTPLAAIDDEMCRYFQVEPDVVKYYCGWYDSIGFRLALGKSFDEIIEEFKEYVEKDSDFYCKLTLIAFWLKDNFESDSWREIGRR